MTTLNPDDGGVVLINTFTVEPERAEALCDLLSTATVDVMRHLPGFVSANLHVSLDRTHVANYAQWESKKAYEAVFADADVVAHMQGAADAADGFEPILYELRHTHGR